MQFSASKEPLITTIHAASIADCLVRVIGMSEQAFSPSTARLLLASCLEGVFFVNVTFTDKGEPVPVVEFLSPQSSAAVRNAIAEGNAKDLVRKIQDELQHGKQEAYITRTMAIQAAQARGLSEAEAKLALGKLTD
jgi:Tfp pilus assembly pilus retraction ATPase PilT